MRVRDAHVARDELAAVAHARPRRRVLVQQVDLLEREPLRLGDAEVREDDAAQARRAPDEEHLHAEAGVAWADVDEVRRRIRDRPVPEPVCVRQRSVLGSGAAEELTSWTQRRATWPWRGR